jgi:hypothetical protein
MKPKFGFLMSEAGELASGGGKSGECAVISDQCEGTGVAASGSDGNQGNDGSAPAPRELSFVEKVAASFQSKGALAADLQAATQRAESAETKLSDVLAEFATVKAERDTLLAEKQEVLKRLGEAETQQKSVAVAAADVVASLGFTPAETQALPGAVEQTESPIKVLEAQYAASSDPVERGKIAAQMRVAMKADV